MYALQSAKDALMNATKGPVQSPKDPRVADLCVPCFAAAKEQGKNPAEVAQKIARSKLPKGFERAVAAGPYVNYFFSGSFFRQVLDETARRDFGRNPTEFDEPVVLEYSQPNPGKPMHLGHIRSTIIGDVCANALQHLGRPVVRLNYLNDRGAHIAELITAMEEFKDLPKVKDEKDLLAYYVKIKSEIDANPGLKEKSRQVLEHLNEHQGQLEKIFQLSMAAFERNYNALGVRFDEYPRETTLEPAALSAVQECLENGIGKKEPDGTIIADLEPELPNTVLLRSNGTPLYFTSDLALADWKHKKYNFYQSWIFTAAEQNLHFKQLQLVLNRLGRGYANRYHHKGFGLVRLTEGKLSTRLGRVVLLEDVIQSVIDEAQNQMQTRNPDEKTDSKIAQAVGIGALKYGVLKVKFEKDITFDPKAEVQFEGDTSAYVQYAHVRASGILEKYATTFSAEEEKQKDAGKIGKEKNKKIKKTGEKEAPFPYNVLPPLPKKLDLNESERLLLKKLAEFPDVLEYVASTMQPHALCEYALSVAKAFTSFYAASPVMNAPDGLKAQRLHITASTRNVLKLALETLGIKALEKM